MWFDSKKKKKIGFLSVYLMNKNKKKNYFYCRLMTHLNMCKNKNDYKKNYRKKKRVVLKLGLSKKKNIYIQINLHDYK